jgi:hypothetical protein
MGLAVTVLLAATAFAVMVARGHAARSDAVSCASTFVHYQAASVPGLSRIPWLRGGAKGQLFLLYYTGALADERVNQSDGAVMYTRGGTATLSTKILWVLRQTARQAEMTGTRLDAPGTFTEPFRRTGSGRFQATARIPTAGCWQLSLRAGTARATAVFEAVDAPAVFSCVASPLRRDSPNPIGNDIPWIVARPSSAGITGTIFYRVPADATAAVIYPDKHAPANGNTKILWKVLAKDAGARLVVLASRLDAPGQMPPQMFDRAFDSSPGASFPSGIDVASTGCWLLTVRSGPAAATVVVQSIPSA